MTASEVTDSRRDTAVATDPTWLYDTGKRALDVALAAILLLPAAPIFLIAAAAIRIESSGSPFFFQKRLGKNGKPFRLIKLRGMYRDAKERFPHLYDYAAQKSLDFYFHHEEDPRVTRVGRFTRRTSIDELPNLLNVLKGDMSMVGPRPEIPEVLDLYGIYRSEYLSVKPGITCTSKCTGRDSITKQQTVELDIQYVRTRGLRTDFKILWRTFCGVVLRRNVY